MTVGISLTNWADAVVLTDSRVSSNLGRQSDSVNKMGEFSQEGKYHGVVYGTGEANLIFAVVNNIGGFSGETLDNFVDAVQQAHKARVDKGDTSWLSAQKAEIEKRAPLIDKPEDRESYVRNEIGELVRRYEKVKSEMPTHFVVVAYDMEAKRVREFVITPYMSEEKFMDHTEVGSGRDGANLYFATKLQGIDATRLKEEDLAFFAVNAYSFANINAGVGGTPKIARISEQGCRIVPVNRRLVLTNLSGAYLAGYKEGELTGEKVREYIKEVFGEGKPDFAAMAAMLDTDERTLTTMYNPYSSWQEKANLAMFPPANGSKPEEAPKK